MASKQVSVQTLIASYRSLGSRWADLDPLKRRERPPIPELDPSFYGLTEADLDQTYSATNTYFTTASTMTLRDILKALRDTYCRSIGAEFTPISDPAAKRWIQEHLEKSLGAATYSADENTNGKRDWREKGGTS